MKAIAEAIVVLAGANLVGAGVIAGNMMGVNNPSGGMCSLVGVIVGVLGIVIMRRGLRSDQ